MNTVFRIIFALAVSLALTFGAFAGTSTAFAAGSQPASADGINPVVSVPTGIGYCYSSGYNRQGWRCGWRLAMAPYNLGDAYWNGGYWYNGVWYSNYTNYGGYWWNGVWYPNNNNYGGYNYPVNNQYNQPPWNNGKVDYQGRPRFGYNYGPYYNYNYGCYCK